MKPNNYSFKGMQVAEWTNEKDGQTSQSYTIKKSYKDKQSQDWKETDSFYESDLASLQVVLTEILSTKVKKRLAQGDVFS